jgi:hypothetical protein
VRRLYDYCDLLHTQSSLPGYVKTMRTYSIKLLLVLTVFLPARSLAQEYTQQQFWQQLLVADQEFAREATEIGRTGAFLNVLGEGSVVFRNGPVDARELYNINQFQNVLDQLTWKSMFVDVSRAGDLGIAIGPSMFTAPDRQSFGFMVGVWQKQAGRWLLMADTVVRIPGVLSLDVVPDFEATRQVLDETAHPVMTTNNDLQSLIDADNLFGLSINFRGGQRALLRYGLENQRVYLPGMAPAIGAVAASTVYGRFLDNQVTTNNPVNLTHMGGFISSSREMGYTYGVMATNTDEADSGFKSSYLRLWRFTSSNEWKIAVEVLIPYSLNTQNLQ